MDLPAMDHGNIWKPLETSPPWGNQLPALPATSPVTNKGSPASRPRCPSATRKLRPSPLHPMDTWLYGASVEIKKINLWFFMCIYIYILMWYIYIYIYIYNYNYISITTKLQWYIKPDGWYCLIPLMSRVFWGTSPLTIQHIWRDRDGMMASHLHPVAALAAEELTTSKSRSWCHWGASALSWPTTGPWQSWQSWNQTRSKERGKHGKNRGRSNIFGNYWKISEANRL